jgi:NitT/TauT family transport system ATP-binding protein
VPDVRSSTRSVPQVAVRLRGVSKAFPADPNPVMAVEDMSFDVAKGEFATILGPSGCGKSTVIRIVAGLTRPTSGTVSVNGAPVARPGRDCSMVFQAYTSFPWLTVLENIAFGLRYTMRGNRTAHLERARYLAQLVGLEQFQDFHINRLSGGMKQRVAIASALATDPKILLMDEPFGALDSQTRMVMQEQLMTIVEKANKTVMFVTHDIEEALLLGDRVYVCSAQPAKILAEFDVPFGRPRSAATRNDQQFFQMKNEIFNLLRDHVHAQAVQAVYERRLRKRG